MAPEPATQEPVAQTPAPAKPSAKKATSKKRVAKKSKSKKAAVKKSAAKKRDVKKPVTAKKSVAKKSVAKKVARKKSKPKKQPASNGTTKAQSIRDMANELGNKARPRDIIAALAAKGITVTSPQVSLTLKAAGLRRGRRRKKVATAVAAQKSSRNGKSQTFNVNDLIQVRKLAAKIGGIEKLKESVAALEKLQSIWIGV
jgi:hypothetical protein